MKIQWGEMFWTLFTFFLWTILFKFKMFFNKSVMLTKAAFNVFINTNILWNHRIKILYFILKCKKINVFFQFNSFISWLWQSWIFSIITPVFSVTWSFRNHSDTLIWCLGKNIIYILIISKSMLKTAALLNMYCDLFFQDYLMNQIFKRTAFFCNFIIVK